MKKPIGYNYFNNLLDHVGKNYKFFGNKFVYPRQLEIHLPANRAIHCNLNCKWCQGRYYKRSLGNWELEGLDLLNNLKGEVPYHIYGGAYTEPLMNLHLMTYLETTKKYGNYFGIHTNGVLLKNLKDNFNFVSQLNKIVTSKKDYLSISLDGGIASDWAKSKNTTHVEYFDEIMEAIYYISFTDRKFTLRLCFLISEHTGNMENFQSIVDIAKVAKVDSLRFSIPYAIYNQDFKSLEEYRDSVEVPQHIKYYEMVKPLLSKDISEVPYIFYVDPATTSVDQYNFNRCIYSYYQITLGADGYFYKCSSTAAPNAREHRLGKITSNLDEFRQIVNDSYDKDWNSKKKCFDEGLRCNRMAIECNQEFCSVRKDRS